MGRVIVNPALATSTAVEISAAVLLSDVRRLCAMCGMEKVPAVVHGKFPYRPAHVVASDWRLYVAFDVWDCKAGKLVYKRVSKIRGADDAERLAYAQALAERINALLVDGYVLNAAAAVPVGAAVRTLGAVVVELSGALGARGGRRSVQAWQSWSRVVSEWLAAAGLEGLPLSDLKREHLLVFLDWVIAVRDVGSRTRNNYLASWKSLLKECVLREWIGKSPADGIADVRAPQQTHVPYSIAEGKIVTDWLLANEIGLYYFSRFIYYAFLRTVEVGRLRVSDLDIHAGTITIRATESKNERAQVLPMIAPLRAMVLEMGLESAPMDAYLFGKGFKPGKTPLHENRVRERYRECLEAVGLYGLGKTLYSWKHTGNVAAYRAGLGLRQLQQLNRHKSEADTLIYLRSLGVLMDAELRGVSW